jgi:hypothetical protein
MPQGTNYGDKGVEKLEARCRKVRVPAVLRTFLGVIACVVAVAAVAPAGASAALGQIGEPWGAQGAGPAQFFNPGAMGVDSQTGDVFAVDFTEGNVAFRIQKLSEEGEFLGSVEIQRKADGIGRTLVGVAVDSARHRMYVVEACPVVVGTTACVANGSIAAINLIAFSTEVTGGQLTKIGTFPLPSGAGEVYEPKAIAVDPSNGDVLILGDDATPRKVIQRIGSGGEIGARFVDAANVLGFNGGRASSLAVGPDGTAYTLTGGRSAGGAKLIRGWQLNQGMSELKELPGFAEAEAAEQWENTLGDEPGGFLRGPTLAVSPDGHTIYWDEKFVGAHTPAVIRAWSLDSHETIALYGQGKTTCKIESSSPAGPGIGAVGERLVAFEYGPNSTAKPSTKVTFGRHVFTFGPGGTGCPSIAAKPPVAKFTINGVEEGASAGEREAVVLDASTSQLFGGVRQEMVWRFGDGKTQVVKCPEAGGGGCAESAPAAVTHRYTGSCKCKVELEIKLENPRAGDPPMVSHNVTIEFRKRFGLTVSKGGAGAGVVSSDWPGIYCGESCKGEFEEKKLVTLVPAAAPGSFFAGWGGACAGAGLCQVTMSTAKAVTAIFEPLPPAPPAPFVPAQASTAAAAPEAPAAKPKPKPKPKGGKKGSKVPAACRKLKGRPRARCVKRHRAKAAKADKASMADKTGSGKGHR